MGPVSATIEIDAPRERVFEAIADLSRRPSFTDHFQTEYRLTRIEPRGEGAGARFRVAQPLRSVWMDTTLVEVEAPHRVVERGLGGRVNRIPSWTLWELRQGPGSLVTVEVAHGTDPGNPVDRAVETLSGTSMWQGRAWKEALRRLRDLLESEARLSAPLAVAGGNPHATGIP